MNNSAGSFSLCVFGALWFGRKNRKKHQFEREGTFRFTNSIVYVLQRFPSFAQAIMMGIFKGINPIRVLDTQGFGATTRTLDLERWI